MERLFAKEAGDGDEMIVLLHGFAGFHGAWRDVQSVLAKRFRTLAYDLPGHGASLSFAGGVSSTAAAAAIFEDMARRGLDRVHLGGHSMGGAMATLMAMTEPRRVKSLTLFAPGGFGDAINGGLLARYAAAITADELRPEVEAMRGPSSRIDDATLDALSAVRRTPGQREKLVEIAARMTRHGTQGVIPRQELEKLQMPVAVAWGTLDNVLPVSQAAGLPPLFAIHLVPEAGHMLPEERPQLAAEIIISNAR